MKDDAQLIDAALEGDSAAFGQLVTRYQDRLYNSLVHVVGSTDLAYDAVQDAFLKLWTHAARWEPGRALFETWLYRVVLNKCYDRLRRRPTAKLDEAVEIADPAPTADQLLSAVCAITVPPATTSPKVRGARLTRAIFCQAASRNRSHSR